MLVKRNAVNAAKNYRKLAELFNDEPDNENQGFAIERPRLYVRRHLKRTLWALKVIAAYKKNLAMGKPTISYPDEAISVRTRGDMNDGTEEDMRQRVARREAARVYALRASGRVARVHGARPIHRHPAAVARRSRRSRVRT